MNAICRFWMWSLHIRAVWLSGWRAVIQSLCSLHRCPLTVMISWNDLNIGWASKMLVPSQKQPTSYRSGWLRKVCGAISHLKDELNRHEKVRLHEPACLWKEIWHDFGTTGKGSGYGVLALRLNGPQDIVSHSWNQQAPICSTPLRDILFSSFSGATLLKMKPLSFRYWTLTEPRILMNYLRYDVSRNWSLRSLISKKQNLPVRTSA